MNAYIQAAVLDFADDLKSLVIAGLINVSRRKAIEEVLKTMDHLAAGETGFLSASDDPGMKK